MQKDVDSIFFENTPRIQELARKCEENNAIERELYTQYEVKRGLRDLNGKGVLAGLTNISDVCAKKVVNGEEVPCEGNLIIVGTISKILSKDFWKHIIRDLRRQRTCFYSVNCRHRVS